MAREWTELELLHELEPVVENAVNRHFSMTKDWNPHDYVPWSEGKNYFALGGRTGTPSSRSCPRSPGPR